MKKLLAMILVMMFALIACAGAEGAFKMGIDAESALRASNNKFRHRFAAVEDQARAMGRTVEDLSLDEMEECWQRAKQCE